MTKLEHQLLEALKAMLDGSNTIVDGKELQQPGERGWGCRVMPTNEACTKAWLAIKAAR